MTQEASNLAQQRYIRALERVVGMGDISEEAKLKCLVTHCPNRADQGSGQYLLTQPNKPGQAPYTWEGAVGPLFICVCCYIQLKAAPWRPNPATQYGNYPTTSQYSLYGPFD